MKPWMIMLGFVAITAILGAEVYFGKLAPEVLTAPVAAFLMWLKESPLPPKPDATTEPKP